ncbi:hypothetical protein AeMF1_019093 [Aphanomyces euteiches]|nr:hypothetical protein AeMF1_019093 [Aphanomyces euteiches]KAH9194175.1 hypothetical protein AeNC1_003852 [Aphanomyces euteiches]
MVSFRLIVAAAALVSPSLQSSCSLIEFNVDYPGNDLRSVDASAPEDCCTLCARDASCKAYSHYLGVCYLKSARGNPSFKSGVRSSSLVSSSLQCTAIEKDIDYFGGDLATFPAAAAEICCSICKATDGCKLFSHADGKCYLKSAIVSRVIKAGVRSAQLLNPLNTIAPTPSPTNAFITSIPTPSPTNDYITDSPTPLPTFNTAPPTSYPSYAPTWTPTPVPSFDFTPRPTHYTSTPTPPPTTVTPEPTEAPTTSRPNPVPSVSTPAPNARTEEPLTSPTMIVTGLPTRRP